VCVDAWTKANVERDAGETIATPTVPSEVVLAMAHEIGNQLGALQLRLLMLKQDASCRQAQGRNLEAMENILNEANELVQTGPGARDGHAGVAARWR
jgi:hypothetical protein